MYKRFAQLDGERNDWAVENLITAKLMEAFCTVVDGKPKGVLEDVRGAALSIVSPTDDEVLAGIMGFTRQLSRFCTLRATLNDQDTVERAAKVVSDINAKLLSFDFRNGSLRKKYDVSVFPHQSYHTS